MMSYEMIEMISSFTPGHIHKVPFQLVCLAPLIHTLLLPENHIVPAALETIFHKGNLGGRSLKHEWVGNIQFQLKKERSIEIII